MIKDLDRSIEKFLKRELPPEFAPPNLNISFARPDDEFALHPAINIFLYNINEETGYRTSGMDVIKKRTKNNVTIQRYPQPRISCSYFITAWSKVDPLDEHRILGKTMEALLRYREMPRETLCGSLKKIEALPAVFALQPSKIMNPGEFWQAMGGKPRPALNYTVILDLALFPQKEKPRVKEMGRRIERKN